MSRQLQIRNSTAEFLIFQAEDKAQGVQVFYRDENIWATQKAMAELYGIDKSGISRHLANIYESGELRPEMTVAKFATVVNRGVRGEVTEEIDFYNLDAIIYKTEFEKFRVIQDRLFESDFDRFALPTLPFEEDDAKPEVKQ